MGRGPRSHRRRARRLLDEPSRRGPRPRLGPRRAPGGGRSPAGRPAQRSRRTLGHLAPSRKSTSPGSSWTSSDSPHTRARSSSDRSAKRGTCRNRSSIRLTRPGGSGGGTSRCAATGLQRQRPSCRMTRGRCHAGYLAPPAGCAPRIARHRGQPRCESQGTSVVGECLLHDPVRSEVQRRCELHGLALDGHRDREPASTSVTKAGTEAFPGCGASAEGRSPSIPSAPQLDERFAPVRWIFCSGALVPGRSAGADNSRPVRPTQDAGRVTSAAGAGAGLSFGEGIDGSVPASHSGRHVGCRDPGVAGLDGSAGERDRLHAGLGRAGRSVLPARRQRRLRRPALLARVRLRPRHRAAGRHGDDYRRRDPGPVALRPRPVASSSASSRSTVRRPRTRGTGKS